MIDETQLLAFYTIEAPEGDMNPSAIGPNLEGKLKSYRHQSGQGSFNEDKTIVKWVDSFDPPHFFEKTLTLSFSLYDDPTNEKGKITFDINRQKAMGHTLKANINKTVKVEKEKISFDTILASPTRTVITGKVQNILELVLDEIKDERLRPKDIEVKLIANDEMVTAQGGGMSTDTNGSTFHLNYDALPEKLDSLKLELVSFTSDNDVNEVITLDKEVADQSFKLLGQEIIINKIYEDNGKTYITITTEENTVLTKLYLLETDKKIELIKTIEDELGKTEQGKMLHTRTLEFDGVATNYKLDIKTMTYSKQYNQIIELPIK
jgi:hypothetical protein